LSTCAPPFAVAMTASAVNLAVSSIIENCEVKKSVRFPFAPASLAENVSKRKNGKKESNKSRAPTAKSTKGNGIKEGTGGGNCLCRSLLGRDRQRGALSWLPFSTFLMETPPSYIVKKTQRLPADTPAKEKKPHPAPINRIHNALINIFI